MPTTAPHSAYPSYERQTVDHPSPLARFSHRSRLRRAVRYLVELTPADGTILDFGAGPGLVLGEVARLGHRGPLLGYEPYMHMQVPPGVTPVLDLGAVPARSVDTLSAFEVLEHLSELQLDEFADAAARLLKPGGRIVLSVPIMLGPPVLAKAVTRRLWLRVGFNDYSVGELLRAGLLFRGPPRPPVVIHSHKGFDHRMLQARLTRRFRLERATTSPLPVLPWWLNSQAFMLFGSPHR